MVCFITCFNTRFENRDRCTFTVFDGTKDFSYWVLNVVSVWISTLYNEHFVRSVKFFAV